MKFILVLHICSSVYLNCLPPVNDTFVFNSWIECANAGYLRAIETTNKMNSDIVNRNKIVVNFGCVEIEES